MRRLQFSAPLLTGCLLVLLCAAAAGPTYLNHDAAWYLHVAAVWMDGATVYRDVIDTNPPLIIMLTAVPVAIARLLDVSAPLVFKFFVAAAGCLTVLIAVPIVRRTWDTESARVLVATVLVFALFPFVRGEFGQREHFAILMVAPYVVAACGWVNGRTSAVSIDRVAGILGGLGFAMKPHFVLAWLALEVCLVVLRPRARAWRRPAAVAAASSFLIYGGAVMAFFPHYVAVVRETSQVYGALNTSISALVRVSEVKFAVLAVLSIVVIRMPQEQRDSCAPLLACAVGFLLAALVQLKGWSYHFLPFRALVMVYFAAWLGVIADSHPAALALVRGGRRTLHAVALAALSIWSARQVLEAWRADARGDVPPIAAFVKERRAESLAFLAMRTHLYPAFPVVNYTGSQWVLRYSALWFLPALYSTELDPGEGVVAFRRPDEMGPLERRYYEQIVDDLCANPPRLIVIELTVPRTPAARGSLDLVAYYRQDPRFAHLFASYAPTTTIGAYAIHGREGPASCGAPARSSR